uniref:Eukaryotic translation initiation factor 2D n=1 Tax=Sinocyclocheilus grahami TaxID=75366 RepID=A0A672TDY3_SINGR
MFTKVFRVNSNTVIKGSDRRKLRADISAAFPSLSAEDLNEPIPNKDELNIVKIYAHKGDAVTLYILHKNPIFFQLEKQVMYTLWRYPTMLPVFVTWPLVLRKLTGGAGQHLSHVARCCGTSVSSAEMRNSGMKGKGVNILDTYMDQAFGDKSHPPVKSVTNSPAQVEGEPEGEECEEEEQEVQDSSDPPPVETSCQSMKELRLDEHELLKEEEPKISVAFFLKQLLHYFFRLCSFSIPEDFEPEKASEEGGGAYPYQPPEITPLYGVTACLEPLFQDAQKKKGTPLKANEVRNIITECVKKNELAHETNKKVTLHDLAQRNWPDRSSVATPCSGRYHQGYIMHFFSFITDQYQIPRKYVQGLDKAPNPCKKK